MAKNHHLRHCLMKEEALPYLNFFQFPQCKFVDDIAGVHGRGRLKKQYPALFVSYGLVLDSAGHNDELAFFEWHNFVAELDTEPALHDEKHLVFILVVMPNEFAFQFVELD